MAIFSFEDKEEIEKHALKRIYAIPELMRFLAEQAGKGATHVEIDLSREPIYAYDWITSFRELSKSEVTGKKLRKLLKEIEELKKK